MIEIINCEQNSDEWHRCRLGLPTASRFSEVMAKGEGKTRAKYMRDLAAEIIRGSVEESFMTVHMERGHALEDEARQLYALMTDKDPVQVGFVRNTDIGAGCSPDSLIGDDGGLEIKTALGHIQIDRLQRGTLPSEHVAQVQGSLWVTGRQFWDYCSYSPGLPPLILKVERDEEYIASLAKAVEAFNEELDAMVQSIRTYSNFKAQAA